MPTGNRLPPGIDEIARIALPIFRRHGVTHVSVFGSVARRTTVPESDIDFLVDYRDGMTAFDILDLKDELEQAFGRKVDLVRQKCLKPRVCPNVLDCKVRIL